MKHVPNRREFLRAAALPALLAAQEKKVRIGVVGLGSRGVSLARVLLRLPEVEIPALCDINESRLRRAQDVVEKAGRPRPQGYSRGVEHFRELAGRQDLDAVINATPWEWHARVSIAAMKAGKYVGTEVPAAITVEECWELVNTSEQTGKPCMILENANYRREVLAVLNMVRQGVLGELVHCEAGYQHDIRNGQVALGRREDAADGGLLWRGVHALKRNANLYPTHPIGPVAWWTNINRGDRFKYLVSMSSKSRGLNHLIREQFGPEHPNAKRRFALGDVNVSLLMTESGLTVTLYHDTDLPRPYDLIFRVQGTKGIYSGTLDKIYVEGRSPKRDAWEEAASYYDQYDHPIWKALGAPAREHGHGGSDYITLHQFVRAVRYQTPTPMDVYDAAAWSVITPLSEQSVAGKSAAVDFPDFTRGKWMTPRPVQFSW